MKIYGVTVCSSDGDVIYFDDRNGVKQFRSSATSLFTSKEEATENFIKNYNAFWDSFDFEEDVDCNGNKKFSSEEIIRKIENFSTITINGEGQISIEYFETEIPTQIPSNRGTTDKEIVDTLRSLEYGYSGYEITGDELKGAYLLASELTGIPVDYLDKKGVNKNYLDKKCVNI